jgi:hypothetical protein
VPVRIFFRGLVLFSAPNDGEPGRIVAELISDGGVKDQKPPHPHHHQAEIQILTGNGPVGPKPIVRGSTIAIRAPADAKDNNVVRRSPSWENFVPKLANVLRQDRTRTKDDNYLHSTVVINGGMLRVRNVVIWDQSGFPLEPGVLNGTGPATPAELKFLGSDVRGHMANECVVEILEANTVAIEGYKEMKEEEETRLTGRKPDKDPGRSVNAGHEVRGEGNPFTSPDTVEILINNYEHQRLSPTPWGMDFQWLFRRAGYSPINLSGGEFNDLRDFVADFGQPNQEGKRPWQEDLDTLLPDPGSGFPFPYIIRNGLTPLKPLGRSTSTEIDSRPVCVPGEDDTTTGGH